MRKVGIITGGILAIVLIGIGTYMERDAIRSRFFSDQPDALPEAVEVAVDTTEPSTVDQNVNEPDVRGDAVDLAATATLPSQFNLAVPFVLQAPTANWDAVHNETCEEASVLTVHFYWTKVKSFSAPQVETQYSKMIAYENKTFGDFKDTTAVQTAKMIKDLYKYKRVDVLPMKSINDAKPHVLAGRPVIIPAAGKLLKNPNFKNGGPLYHMLVVRGWLKDGRIITNDPGTRKGNGYVYSASTLWNAIHDWNGGNVTAGKKVMIVVYPNGK
ncbi:MAG: C39 family peptidase [bacterium]|nr:C39 family peptidase [bacterium]